MPLSKNDPTLDYGGSWDHASRDWPRIEFRDEEEARRAYVLAWRHYGVPYGSYVIVGNVLRLETQEYVDRVREAMAKS